MLVWNGNDRKHPFFILNKGIAMQRITVPWHETCMSPRRRVPTDRHGLKHYFEMWCSLIHHWYIGEAFPTSCRCSGCSSLRTSTFEIMSTGLSYRACLIVDKSISKCERDSTEHSWFRLRKRNIRPRRPTIRPVILQRHHTMRLS